MLYASFAFAIAEKDNTIQLIANYTQLNNIIVKKAYLFFNVIGIKVFFKTQF